MVCVSRVVVPILLVSVALPLFAASRKGSSHPPKQLHKVGDHWTAYDPPDPANFPPGSKSHVIVQHDTLWDLATKYYGNAYLWPQLWESNTYITDAHWIYPGDPLLIEGETTSGGTSASATSGTTTIASGESGMAAGSASVEGQESTPGVTARIGTSGLSDSPIALGAQSDIYCWGYLGATDEALPNKVVSFEDAVTKFVPGDVISQDIGVPENDIIYINGGTSTGLTAGETYLVVMPGPLIHHPKTHEVVGRHYAFRGQVRILCASEDRATGIVTQSCSDIHIGDRLKPMPQLPIPISRLSAMATVCSPSSGKASGFIVNSKDFTFSLGEGQVVELNLGKDDFVQPGDFLTVYRESPDPGNPPQLLGEIGVLTAEAHTATAKIIRMRYSMAVGDRVEVK
jgi:hypothetical protein